MIMKTSLVKSKRLTDAAPKAIPAFFLTRAAGWVLLGLAVFAFSLIWSASTGWNAGSSIILMAAAMLALMWAKAAGLIHTAKLGQWFSLLLICKDVEFVKAYRDMGNYLNPVSQTAFRSVQRVTFESVDGLAVSFDFDRSRKFMLNAQYDFYFMRPKDGREVTVDMLEGLKIDHAIHPQSAQKF